MKNGTKLGIRKNRLAVMFRIPLTQWGTIWKDRLKAVFEFESGQKVLINLSLMAPNGGASID